MVTLDANRSRAMIPPLLLLLVYVAADIRGVVPLRCNHTRPLTRLRAALSGHSQARSWCSVVVNLHWWLARESNPRRWQPASLSHGHGVKPLVGSHAVDRVVVVDGFHRENAVANVDKLDLRRVVKDTPAVLPQKLGGVIAVAERVGSNRDRFTHLAVVDHDDDIGVTRGQVGLGGDDVGGERGVHLVSPSAVFLADEDYTTHP